MRQIKFRGKDLNTNNWVYGDLEIHRKDSRRLIHSYNENGDYSRQYDVDEETIGQFTGLQDKNGTDVYEGDILSIASKSDKPFGIVMWHKEGYFCVEENLSASEPSDHISIGELLRVSIFEFKVIGNRWDNPEILLKK